MKFKLYRVITSVGIHLQRRMCGSNTEQLRKATSQKVTSFFVLSCEQMGEMGGANSTCWTE